MSRFWRSLKLGMKSLMLHKLRSALTVLGIVFGVAAVIAMLAVSEGFSREQQERLQALGAVNIIYRSVKPSEEAQAAGGRPARILNYGLKYEDYERILATVPTIKKALPIREIRKEIRRLNRAIDGRVVGTTHLYADFNKLTMARGRFLSQADDEHFENYAVLGAEVAEKLFPYEDPIGDTVKLGSDYYTVIGGDGAAGLDGGDWGEPSGAGVRQGCLHTAEHLPTAVWGADYRQSLGSVFGGRDAVVADHDAGGGHPRGEAECADH
ncbi:MAG: hypothetical protein KatS3mg108_2809 [Isosphaeraceae bacterium]|nr:MAG: hypothetical protein KatS3mg108_2809 [Isosphaeraceae bacterium]